MDELEAVLDAGERELLRRVDGEVAAASAAGAAHLKCALGCTACCTGPFPITSLDARRLAAGLAELRRRRPWEADAVEAAARAQWSEMATVFPGDPAAGTLADGEEERAAFMERFAETPCPALDPGSGACRLYGSRPLTCRQFGLPVAADGGLEAPCELNFTSADAETVARAAVAADPGGLEARLLALLGDPPETVVAAALVVGARG